eukprot:XP_794933.3 PREDICTED: uncharacterized protein LOC590230 [Strongylocentrotus purpuratus]
MFRIVNLVCLVLGGLIFLSHQVSCVPDTGVMSSSISLGEVEPHICPFRGTPYLPGETIRIDECTLCICDMTVPHISCQVTTCQPVDCARPVKHPGECCHRCPHNVLVQKVSPLVVSQDHIEDLVQLRVPIEFQETPTVTKVEGESLWKLSGWVALHHANSSKGYDYQDQLLSVEDMSKTYETGKDFIFESVGFPLLHPTVVCHKRPFFICVRLEKQPTPQLKNGGDFDLSGFPDDASLTGCTATTLLKKWCTRALKSAKHDTRNESSRLDGRLALIMTVILRVLLSLY